MKRIIKTGESYTTTEKMKNIDNVDNVDVISALFSIKYYLNFQRSVLNLRIGHYVKFLWFSVRGVHFASGSH